MDVNIGALLQVFIIFMTTYYREQHGKIDVIMHFFLNLNANRKYCLVCISYNFLLVTQTFFLLQK